MSRSRLQVLKNKEPLRVGFLPVSDCAPLVYALEAGLFEKYELDVQLQRETSWASIRDKVIQGDLDAAHAPVTLPFLANLGVESDPCACISGLVLSLQGNAITVSRGLWEQGVRDPRTLREHIYKTWRRRTLTFGVVFPFSAQYLLLRQWLRLGEIVPDVEVRVLVIPPSQMFPMLKLGYIDGYCAGEPWGSVAAQAGVGVCVATSADLAPLHPEKVLMVRQSFALGRADEHERLLAALLEACAFCDQPENRALICEMLAHPAYVDAPAESLRPALVGPFQKEGNSSELLPELTIFHRHRANDPTNEKANWVMENLYEYLETNQLHRSCKGRTPVLKNIFRRDIFEGAKSKLACVARQLDREATRYESQSVRAQ